MSAGSSATVSNSGSSSAATFNFGIPQGIAGTNGSAATIAVGTTTTLSAGSSATVTNVGSSSAATFNFGIPQGIQGSAASATTITHVTGASGSSSNQIYLTGSAPAYTIGLPSNIYLGYAGNNYSISNGSIYFTGDAAYGNSLSGSFTYGGQGGSGNLSSWFYFNNPIRATMNSTASGANLRGATTAVGNQYEIYYSTSSKKYKTNIQTLPDEETILDVRSVSFNPLDSSGNPLPEICLGFIAEEMEENEIGKYFVVKDYSENIISFNYDYSIAAFAGVMRCLRTRIIALETENTILKESNVNLAQRVTQLETTLQSFESRIIALESQV